MNPVALFFSACFFILGIISVFFKETAWKFTKWGNDISGSESKRTKAWEQGQIVMGIVMIIIAILFAIYGFTYPI